MKGLSYYEDLLVTLSEQALNQEFAEFFTINYQYHDYATNLEILNELADRQWHTYSLPSSHLQHQVSQYLLENIDIENENVVDLCLLISISLGLADVYHFILTKKPHIQNPKAIHSINEFEVEIKDISDPYIGIR